MKKELAQKKGVSVRSRENATPSIGQGFLGKRCKKKGFNYREKRKISPI